MLYVRIHERYQFEYLFSIVKRNDSSTFYSPTGTFIFSWQSWNNACACLATVSNLMCWFFLLTWHTRLYTFPDNGIWAVSQTIILHGPRRWYILYYLRDHFDIQYMTWMSYYFCINPGKLITHINHNFIVESGNASNGNIVRVSGFCAGNSSFTSEFPAKANEA